MMLEWLSEKHPRARVSYKKFIESTSLWDRYKTLCDQPIATYDGTLESHRQLMQRVLQHARDKGWIEITTSNVGRNPDNDARYDEISQAIRNENSMHHSFNGRDRYVLYGRKTTDMIIVLPEPFFEFLSQDAHELGIEGMTRNEIAEHLGIARCVVNRIVRTLRKHGWAERKETTPEGRKHVLRPTGARP